MRGLLIAAAIAIASAGAIADPVTFKFDLTGTDYVSYDPEFCYPNCPPDHSEPWVGTLSVTLANSLDGVYTDDSILAVTMATNELNWTTDGFGESTAVYSAPHDFVTLAGGQIVAMSGGYASGPDKAQLATFTLNNAYYLSGVGKSYRHDQAGAILTIPEPSTYALMIGGLGLLATACRQRNRRSFR